MSQIQAIGIEQYQMKLMKDMQTMVEQSGSSLAPAVGLNTMNASSSEVSFSQVMKQAVDNVNAIQNAASVKQTEYELGLHDDLASTMLESQKANVAFSAMLQTRNKLTSALEELMNIPL